MGATKIQRTEKKVRSGYQRTNFGFLVKLIVANPIMPLVMIFGVFFFSFSVFEYFRENNRGVEFFVESEPEQAIVYVKARGNLSLMEKDQILKGKLNKFLKENTLLGQALITDPKKSVGLFLNEISKNNNITLNIISMDLYTI